MSDHEVGRLYKATVRHSPDQFAIPIDDGRWMTMRPVGVSQLHHPTDVTDIRGPLVVLDLTDVDGTQFDPARLAGLLTAAQSAAQTAKEARMVRSLRDQIIEQTKPPKPAEPKGLGAVVKDCCNGQRFVRASLNPAAKTPWVSEQGTWRSFADIDVPDADHILSKGVEL